MMNLFRDYEMTTAAHAYIIGFQIGTKVYQIILKTLPEWLLKMDRESTSHGGAQTPHCNDCKK